MRRRGGRRTYLTILISFVWLLAGSANALPPLRWPVKATAYCGCEVCCGKWSKHRRTKSGTVPTAGRTIAVDPRVFPLGSCIRLDGREYRAEDTGSKVKGHRVDIYHDDHQEALRFGVQEVIATIC